VKLVPTAIPGVVVIESDVHEDARGFFTETWHRRRFEEAGLTADFVQDNHSRSRRGALRGLHFQRPHEQVKLARVIAGEVFDVVVDVRKGSPTFGKAVWETLSAANRKQLWIPAGFAHGFLTLSETADFLYKCSDYYSPADEKGVLWNDPALAIPWPLADVVVSEKDRKLPRLAEL
jgi:dTDP-4-dehydrorhamnose 3,5-epimerase